MANGTLEKPKQAEVVQAERGHSGQCYRPNVDILDGADGLTVFADLPGATRDDIDIDFENGVLTIRGRVKGRTPEGADHVLREFGVGDFYRTFRVGEKIDAAHISAGCADGVLKLHLPKVELAKPRKITIRGDTP